MTLYDAIQCYRIIYDEKNKKTTQLSLDRFFRPKEDEPQPSTSSFIEEPQEEEQHLVSDEDEENADDPPLIL